MRDLFKTNWQKAWFQNIVYLLMIASVSFIIYLNSLNGDFIIDDVNSIQNNPRIKDISFYFANHFKFSPDTFNEAILALIWHVSRDNPFGFHLFNVIIHILCVVFIYIMCLIIFDDRLLAFFSSLIFAIHPIHTEAVSWISGRPYVLYSLFYLSIFVSYLKIKDSRRYYLLSILLFLIGLLFSKLILAVPFMIFAYEIFFKKTDFKDEKEKKFLLVLLAMAGLISILVLSDIYLSRAAFSHMIFRFRGWSYLVVAIKAFAYYIKILYLPLARGLYHPFALNNLGISKISPLFFVSILILLFSIFAFFKCRKEFKPISFGIMWFFLTYLPYSNLIPVCNIISERYLYLPSVGICIILAALFLKSWGIINRSAKNKKALYRYLAIAALVLFLSSYAVLTLRRNYDYNDILTYWWSNINNFPDGDIVYNNLAGTFYAMGDLDNAMAYCYTTLLINRDQPYVWCNLGRIYTDLKNLEQAAYCYDQALEIDKSYLPAIKALERIKSR